MEFFVMGEGYGYGFKGFTYQYQITSQGVSLIPVSYLMDYVLKGTLSGKTGVSITLWIAGMILFLTGMTVYLVTYDLHKKIFTRFSSVCIILSAIFLIISSMVQYGIFFVGPAGVSILIGIPVLIGFGWYLKVSENSLNNISD